VTIPRIYNDGTDIWEAIAMGEQGPQGERGDDGPPGPQGNTGAGVHLRGAYFGTDTALPVAPEPGDMWVLGIPLPTLAPDQMDDTPKANGDGMVYDTIGGWVNSGPIRGPRGFEGPPGPDVSGEIAGELDHDGTTAGFYGATPTTKPTVTGSRGGNAALASLLAALATLGLITDSTSA
jgi:hypothetical protein